MKPTSSKKRKRADDAPLTKRELATARPLKQVFPDLAAHGRKRARKGEPTKQSVSIRLSPEVIAFFKARGEGWQTRINSALEAFVEASE